MDFESRSIPWLVPRMAGVARLLCSCCLFVAVVAATNESSVLEQCISHFDPAVDYYRKFFPPDILNQSFVLPLPLDLQEVDTATGFAVSYGNYYKIVEDQFFNLTYILYQCGAPRPSSTALGLPADTDRRTFRLPIANITVDSTVTLAFLELLGKLDNLSLTSSAFEYVSSPCVVKYLADGDVAKVPDSGMKSAVVFTAAGGRPINESNAVSFDATYDGGPLKRAEWIKYLATFLNAEQRADYVFSAVNKSYQCMNGSMGDSKSKPKIAWLEYDNGIWSVSNAAYKLQLGSDAGGINVPTEAGPLHFSVLNSDEIDVFHQLLNGVDLVIDETYAPNPYAYTIDQFRANVRADSTELSLPVLVNKRVWRVDKRLGLSNGYDWYESAIPQPHVVLHDMIGMLYPSKGWNITYFRNIAMHERPENVSAGPCEYQFGDTKEVADIYGLMNCPESAASSFRRWSVSILVCAMIVAISWLK